MARRISVSVNDRRVEIYAGMEVQHALTAYNPEVSAACRRGELIVTDGHGFRVGLHGALSDGARLFVTTA